jgi:ribose transport system substrate-binding protein
MQDSKYQAQLGLSMCLAAKAGKLDVKSLPAKYRQFVIPGINVNRANVDQVENDYVKNTPVYNISDFFAQWVAVAP